MPDVLPRRFVCWSGLWGRRCERHCLSLIFCCHSAKDGCLMVAALPQICSTEMIDIGGYARSEVPRPRLCLPIVVGPDCC